MIQRLEVINGGDAPRDALKGKFADIPAAVEAINATHKEVWLELRPLTGGPSETRLHLALSDLMVPSTNQLLQRV